MINRCMNKKRNKVKGKHLINVKIMSTLTIEEERILLQKLKDIKGFEFIVLSQIRV